MLEFTRPIWLLLLLALPAIWWLALRMSYASLGPGQKWVSLALRTVIWLLLVFSIAGVQFVRISDRVSVVVVRDSSDSIDDPQVQGALSEVEIARQEMKKDDTLGLVNFGRDAYLEFLPRSGVDERALRDWQTDPRGNFTDIGEALRLATASFPDNAQKRLVLITDGNENIGNSLAEARVARDNGIELMVVPIQSTSGPEVVLSSLETPSQASIGETVNVRFVLDSTVTTPANVSLIRNGEFVDKVKINIREGKEVYEFPIEVDESGFQTYELSVEPEIDTIAENNRAYTFSLVEGQPRLLYATGDAQELAYLPRTLNTHNIQVDVVPPGGIPYSMDDFQSYDGIIFSDVAAFDISPEQMQMIQVLVRDFGRGFMMIGGEKSFGPGGYFDTPIEETLPVDMDFRRKRITPSSLVVCLIDKSGSMGETVGGMAKMEMAKEACVEVVKLQANDDYVGVMGFDGVGQWVVEPAKGIDKEGTISKIRSMQAGGGTDLYPALKSAYEASQSIPVQVKHFIVFTDGIVAPGDFAGITKEMTDNKCTISTVAFGTDADIPFMKDLAKMGGGNMYEANSLYDLPRIFTREVFLANKATLTEEPFYAKPVGNNPLTSTIGWSNAPLLFGYVATSAKDEAQVSLLTHKDDPLLATWRYGLGKSAAFTSDAKNRWARDWLGWGGYERFWTGVARWIRSDLDSSGVEVTTTLAGGEGVIRVSAVTEKGEFVNYSSTEARITDPNLESQSIELNQTGPGQYEGRFQVSDNGNYFVNVVQYNEDEEGNATPIGAQAGGLAVSYSPEYRELRRDDFLLSQLTASSLLPDGVSLAGLFTEERKPSRRKEDAWELFTTIALLLWLIDVAVRRLVLDWQQLRFAFAGALVGPGARRAVQTKESLAGLLNVKQNVQHSRNSPLQQQQLEARRQNLSRKAAEREKAGAAPEPTAAPAARIEAPPAQRASDAAGSLSTLRKKLETKEPGAPGFTPGQQFESKTTPKPAAPATPKPPGASMSEREMTSRLLEIKKKRQDKD